MLTPLMVRSGSGVLASSRSKSQHRTEASVTEEWLEPWHRLGEGRERLYFEAELEKEIGQDHPLSGLPRRILARRHDQDDVLVALENGENGRVAEVHLTWRQSREPDPRWPETTIFESIGEWRRLRMNPLHEELDSW